MTTTIFINTDTEGFKIKLQSSDRYSFKKAIEWLKVAVPADLRSYDPQARQWFVDMTAGEDVREWLSSCESCFAAEVKWNGANSSGTTGRKQEPTRPPRQQPRIDPYAALHLLPTAPPDVVKAAYRALATINHPDHGGDMVAMQRINTAYAQLTT